MAFSLRWRADLPLPWLWLVGAGAASFGAVALVVLGTLSGWLPTIFVQGHGGTPQLMQQNAPAMNRFGLFGIRERIELIRGRMDIDSAPGEGCRVTLRVPVAAEPQAAAHEPGSAGIGWMARSRPPLCASKIQHPPRVVHGDGPKLRLRKSVYRA